MKKRIKNLWIEALKGDEHALAELGFALWNGKGCRKNRALARVCLERSAAMGNRSAFFLYHRLFSRGRKVIDDQSYRDIFKEYLEAPGTRSKRELMNYLRLGTREQKREIRDRMMRW